MSFLLDASTALDRQSDGSYCVKPDSRFWNFRSLFGGWVAAIAVAAIESEPDYRGELITQDVQFHSGVRGELLLLIVQCVERRRTIDFWRVTVAEASAPSRVLAASTLVTGLRADTETRFEAPAASVRAQEDSFRLRRAANTPAWLDHFEIFLAKGRPHAINLTPDSATYVRETDGRPLDARALVAIADTPMPRTFFVSEQRLFASTVALSTHIYANAQELADSGNDFVLLDTGSQTIRHSFLNQETRIYRADGLLLATSYQTGLFRENSDDSDR